MLLVPVTLTLVSGVVPFNLADIFSAPLGWDTLVGTGGWLWGVAYLVMVLLYHKPNVCQVFCMVLLYHSILAFTPSTLVTGFTSFDLPHR